MNFAQAGRLRCFGRACSGLLLYHPSSCFDQKEVMKCDNSQTITAKSGFTQSKSLGNKYYTTFRNWSFLDIIAICSRNSHNIHTICTCSSFVGVSKQRKWCFFVALWNCKRWTKKSETYRGVSLPWYLFLRFKLVRSMMLPCATNCAKGRKMFLVTWHHF